MRYYVKLSEALPEVAVDIEETADGSVSVKIDGRRVDADVSPVGGQLSIRVDGKIVDLTTEGATPRVGVIGRGYRTYVGVESERERAAGAAKKGGRGGDDRLVRAPMPGRIVKVFVQKGDTVDVGQPLVVMEAMKMENEIRAKGAGTVAEVHVTAGATVEGSAKLITFS